MIRRMCIVRVAIDEELLWFGWVDLLGGGKNNRVCVVDLCKS